LEEVIVDEPLSIGLGIDWPIADNLMPTADNLMPTADNLTPTAEGR
jgi:hypothetical protein